MCTKRQANKKKTYLPNMLIGLTTRVTNESDTARFPTNMNSNDLVFRVLQTATSIRMFPKFPMIDATVKTRMLPIATPGDSWTN